MRIERINDNQLRFTLNEDDLKARQIGIDELAYGTAKAKALFQDMLQQASYAFGFRTDGIPLMIEAVPLLPKALILDITKVEEPDELDTRFSSFTEEPDWYSFVDDEIDYNSIDLFDFGDNNEDEDIEFYDGAYEDEVKQENPSSHFTEWDFSGETSNSAVLDDNKKQKKPLSGDDFISLPEMLGMEPKPINPEHTTPIDLIMLFSFPCLNTVIQLAYHISDIYHGKNTLYKDTSTGTFYLELHRSNHTPEEFSKICNIIYEYGISAKHSAYTQFYIEEHFTSIIADNAIEKLATI